MTGAPMQYTSKGCKNDNFQMSLLMFFLFLLETLNLGSNV